MARETNKNFIFKKNIYSVLYRHIFASSDGILAIGKEATKFYKNFNLMFSMFHIQLI